MSLRLKLLLLLMFISVPLVHAKQYKWVDKDGNVSYQDRPPSEAGYRVEEKNFGARSAATDSAAGDAAEKFPVVLYSTPKCGPCDSARAYLSRRGVPFSEKNVDGNRKLQDELIKQAGGLSVPTITIGTKVMRGYIESLVEGELDQAGYPKSGAEKSPQSPQSSESPESPQSSEER